MDGRKFQKERSGRQAVSPLSTSQGIETSLLIVLPLFLASKNLGKKSYAVPAFEESPMRRLWVSCVLAERSSWRPWKEQEGLCLLLFIPAGGGKEE